VFDGAKKGGLKGAIVGGAAGAMVDSLNKPKKKNGVKTEEVEPVNEILGMAAGALGAMKGIAAGKAAGALAGKAAMKTAVKSGLTKTASGKAAAKMGARAAAMKTGVGAAASKGAMGAINYGTGGAVAGAGLKSASNMLSGGAERKRTISADADLFDIVKGKLLDEGLTEEESLDVMLTLTLEEINEVVKLDEVTAGLLMKAAKAAEVARGKAAVMGNKALAVKKMGQGEKFYKGAVAKKKAAGQMGVTLSCAALLTVLHAFFISSTHLASSLLFCNCSFIEFFSLTHLLHCKCFIPHDRSLSSCNFSSLSSLH
jgi:hypothetical protein